MILDILDPSLSPNSNSSSSIHLISSPGSRISAYPRRPKEAGTRSLPRCCFAGRLPQPAAACRYQNPFLASISLKPDASLLPRRVEDGYHQPSRLSRRIKRKGFPLRMGGGPIAALPLFLLFPALKSEAEAEPACRNRPIASRSSPFSSISAFNLPKSIIIVLRHCVHLANPQTALVFVLLELKACARLHECWFSRT